MCAFSVTGELRVKQNGVPIEEGFRDGNGLPADGLEAIFPIFRMPLAHDWTPLGTGFFISNNGLFATAKHVLIDDHTGEPFEDLCGAHILRLQNRIIIREILKIAAHESADVAIAVLGGPPSSESIDAIDNKCFGLTYRIPERGNKVVTCAFPESKVVSRENGFDLFFPATSVVGEVEEHFPDGRDRVFFPASCFQTTMRLLGGSSGGPVAFGDGRVFGINSSGFDGTNISFVSSIRDIMELKLVHVSLPGGDIRNEVTIHELSTRGLVSIR